MYIYIITCRICLTFLMVVWGWFPLDSPSGKVWRIQHSGVAVGSHPWSLGSWVFRLLIHGQEVRFPTRFPRVPPVSPALGTPGWTNGPRFLREHRSSWELVVGIWWGKSWDISWHIIFLEVQSPQLKFNSQCWAVPTDVRPNILMVLIVPIKS
jgi:hypothetical protein